MSNLSYLLDIYSESTSSELTKLLNYLGVILAILVVSSKNPVISLLYLIGLFVDVAVYLISLNLTYLGLSYITVYVGAIAMLFIFVIMMLNIQVIEKSKSTNYESIPLGLIIGAIYTYLIYKIIPQELKSKLVSNTSVIFNEDWFHKIYFTNWEDRVSNPTIVESIGTVLYTQYSIWLLIISLILILAMIGAIIIATPKRSS